MSKSVKIWLITATVLVALGSILFAGVMVAYDWDFTGLSTDRYITNNYEVDGEFDKISINVNTTEIEFVPAENENCSIVCVESEKVSHSVSVQNGILVIDTTDTRKWYDYIGIHLENPKMTVYLPQREYASLFIETDTGDITVPEDFSFKNIEIDGDTSDVECFAFETDAVKIELSTGDICIDAVTAKELDLATDTGDINVNSVTVKNDIDIETDTGDVRFEDSDAAQIFVKTNTGDVTGNLLTDKVFITQTDTGRIDVPKTTTGGKCEITTSSGDIEIDVTSWMIK